MTHRICHSILNIIILCCLASCAVNHGPVYVKDGKKYGVVCGNFTDRWYDYYERGLSYKEGAYYSEALSDIDQAIRIKQRDQRWVNTYGMHFIDYFPHREKGIIYFFMGAYKRSEDELILSMHHAPSAKASHFLDQVRINIMRDENKAMTSPKIDMLYPRRTNEEEVEIRGVVTDECYVSGISIAGGTNLIDVSGRHMPFSKRLALPEGNHRFQVEATNLMGGHSTETVDLQIDRSGPAIIITRIVTGIEIDGYVADPSDVVSFTVDGDERIDTVTHGFFSIKWASGHVHHVIGAADALGNNTVLTVDYPPMNRSSMDAATSHDHLLAASRMVLSDTSERLMRSVDRIHIAIDGFTDPVIAYKHNINIKGSITSEATLTSVTISVEDASGDHLSMDAVDGSVPMGKIMSFNRSVSLKEGANRVTIRAGDVSGDVCEKELTIIGRTPEIFKIENRFSLKVHPLDERIKKYENPVVNWLFGYVPVFKGYARFMDTIQCDMFRRCLEKDILARKRFQLVALDQSGVMESSTVQKEGTLDGSGQPFADALLIGNSCVDRDGTEVTVRLIDLMTFEEMVVKDVFTAANSFANIKSMALTLSEKFHQALPVVRGRIETISDRGGRVTFEGGTVQKGWPLLVYTDQKDSDDGVECAARGCEAHIVGLCRMGSDQTIHLGKALVDVAIGDKVINK